MLVRYMLLRVASRKYLRVTGQNCSGIESGLTLLENMVVVLLIGILAAIAAPVWLHLVRVMSLNNAQDQVSLAMRKAQQNARIRRIEWEFAIRQIPDSQVQWAIYPKKLDKSVLPTLQWQSLDPEIQLDPNETTLATVDGVRRIQFNHLGAVNGQLGRVTLSIKGGGRMKRCVIVSTLLGSMRLRSDQPKPVDGKYCR